jgi:RimJ/RimL family protein N-acetyltransferase
VDAITACRLREHPLVPTPVLRPYEPRDREAVRHICFVTGYLGDPVAWQWRDEPSFADMFSSYYTDHEPGSASVVEVDGVVSGYLLGCVDSTKAANAAAIAARHAVRRGIAFRPGTAGVVWRSARDVVADLVRRRVTPAELDIADARWPAHLHIDLLPVARGCGAGQALVRGWLSSLRDQGVPGCHLQTMQENTGAIAFFEAMGFRRHGRPVPAPGLRTPEGDRLHLQVMVQDLAPAG